jgi:DNA polymerase family B
MNHKFNIAYRMLYSLNLAEKDGYKLLKIFYHLSKEVGQDFFSTCNYAKPTSWWRNKLALLGYQKVTRDAAMWQAEHIIRDSTGRPKKGVPYTGGKVFEPLVGLHRDVITYDVGSMYPTMGNIKNISSETINCDCCKTDPGAKIPDDVMMLINGDLVKDGHKPRPWHYWICKQRRGILAEIMEDLFNKKSEYKKCGLSLEEKAVKLFANSGYGAFGQVNFEYYDFRVAELITGFARRTLIGLEQLLRDNGFQILYGDTDSLFVKNINNVDSNNVILMAKEKYDVEFSEDKNWKVLFLLKEKKQYFGVLKNGKLSYKKLLGLKNSYPSFFNEIITSLIGKEIVNSQDRSSDRNLRVSNKIRAAFWEMKEAISTRNMVFIVQKLAYSMKSVKALYEFTDSNRKCWQKYIFDEKLEDYIRDQGLAEMNSQGKTVYRFWKILPPHNEKGSKDKTRKSCTMHPEKYTLDANAYRRDLWSCIVPILEVYGFTDNECNKLKKELVGNQEDFL